MTLPIFKQDGSLNLHNPLTFLTASETEIFQEHSNFEFQNQGNYLTRIDG